MKKFLSIILAVLMIAATVPMAFAEGDTYEVGDIIQFGSYPQTEVKDEALLLELNRLAPAWDNWTSYDYYWDVDGAVVQTSWMRYTDVEFGGNKYRGVKFLKYRPGFCDPQEANGYLIDMTYWFKFEPIDWRVLDPVTGYVMSELLLDSQPYSNTIYGNIDDGLWFNDIYHTNYANDYETSNIRRWLNEDFYNSAFTDDEKEEISITTLNNDITNVWGEFFESSNATNDKVFLPSSKDIHNSDFGFKSHADRMAESSDYAKCQGLYVWRENASSWDGNSDWILRAPIENYCQIRCIRVSGYDESMWVTEGDDGIRPALKLNDINNLSHEHDYNAKVYAPTCTDEGYTTYTCVCGDSYVDNYINAKGHIDNNGDYKCDYDCGYEFEKPAPSDPSENCDCNCHKGGIAGFFFKILNFFQKLFGKNKVCACGVKH